MAIMNEQYADLQKQTPDNEREKFQTEYWRMVDVGMVSYSQLRESAPSSLEELKAVSRRFIGQRAFSLCSPELRLSDY